MEPIKNYLIFWGGWLVMPMRHFQKTLIIMGSEVVPILLFWAIDGFQPCARRALTPSEMFFWFLDSILLTSPFVLFLYFWGWLVMPTPLVKTSNIADTSLSGSFLSCTYICCFRLWTFFSCASGWHPAPQKTFFWFLDSITSNKPIHNCFIFLGGGWSCLPHW